MIFNPERCSIPDEPGKPFIDVREIENHLSNEKADPLRVKEIINKAIGKERLTLAETAALLNADDPEQIEAIKDGAKRLKDKVYGNRIVLFAPLYIGNKCINNCAYCGFRTSNKEAIRKTLSDRELIKEVEALEESGQKRLILVYGEHPEYDADYIAHTVKTVYNVKKGNGEIRRVNINAAPLDIEGFKKVKDAEIGTYQIFQETYHPKAYGKFHLGGQKKDFENRLTALDRAQIAGIDDVGIGALFGLYDWKFEVMALVRHTIHFEACFKVGPHTISFPRIQEASTSLMSKEFEVSDDEFTRLIAVLRLAVPYTGLILTARESPAVRDEVLAFGVSQIDGGTKIELGSYADTVNEFQNLNREQFQINDSRSLEEIMSELLQKNYLPSFCTACYRLGRTGEHFMEFSVPGFIKRYCTPNAMLTLAEYLTDYAGSSVKEQGWKVIKDNLDQLDDESIKNEIIRRLEKIKNGQRDLYF